jgi:tRNA threonylcarbamoyl adenosine modification protein YeaZ
MLILAIDTSGKSGGISLAAVSEESVRMIESAAIAGGTFSAQLIPTLSALLSKHGYAAKDLGGFAAASGPGSFTGLRVGLSAIKGLAEALNKPIAVVSVLEALAVLAPETGKVAAALDAGRSEVFLGIYELEPAGDEPAGNAELAGDSELSGNEPDGNRSPAPGTSPALGGPPVRKLSPYRMLCLSEELLSQSTFVEKLRAEQPAALVTSDRSGMEAAAAAEVRVQLVARPGSEIVAQLGGKKLMAGETIGVEELDANYLRRSDAEILFQGDR